MFELSQCHDATTLRRAELLAEQEIVSSPTYKPLPCVSTARRLVLSSRCASFAGLSSVGVTGWVLAGHTRRAERTEDLERERMYVSTHECMCPRLHLAVGGGFECSRRLSSSPAPPSCVRHRKCVDVWMDSWMLGCLDCMLMGRWSDVVGQARVWWARSTCRERTGTGVCAATGSTTGARSQSMLTSDQGSSSGLPVVLCLRPWRRCWPFCVWVWF